MNYIAEINSFYKWKVDRNKKLGQSGLSLWHVLMQINNKQSVLIDGQWYWPVEFSVPNIKLISILEFSRQQLDRVRNVLMQSGRIVYRKGRGNQSGMYRMVPFHAKEGYVGSYKEKVWIVDTASNNVTQLDEQPLASNNVTQHVTQYETQSGHKADTNEDLCNIYGTIINKKNNILNNNYKYKNNFFVVDDEYRRAREENTLTVDDSLSGYLPELNRYFGMTENLKREAAEFTDQLFRQYFTRCPSKQDIISVFERSYRSECDNAGEWSIWLDEDKKSLLEYAFSAASASGAASWNYIDGVLARLRQRGLTNADECEIFDAERDYRKEKGER